MARTETLSGGGRSKGPGASNNFATEPASVSAFILLQHRARGKACSVNAPSLACKSDEWREERGSKLANARTGHTAAPQRSCGKKMLAWSGRTVAK